MEKLNNEIVLVFDQAILMEYRKQYFIDHPRARKFPFKDARHPSINIWKNMTPIQYNTLKQQWKDFVVFCINKYGYSNLNIVKCKITMIIHSPTKRRCDADNYTPKMIFDGFVEAGLLADDSFFVVEELTIKGIYDKDNPATTFIINYESEDKGGN